MILKQCCHVNESNVNNCKKKKNEKCQFLVSVCMTLLVDVMTSWPSVLTEKQILKEEKKEREKNVCVYEWVYACVDEWVCMHVYRNKRWHAWLHTFQCFCFNCSLIKRVSASMHSMLLFFSITFIRFLIVYWLKANSLLYHSCVLTTHHGYTKAYSYGLLESLTKNKKLQRWLIDFLL